MFSKILEGSSRHLERFWTRLSVCRAERADQRLLVVAAWRPPSVRNPPPGTPSRIADPGLFWAIFQVGSFPEERFCVVRINCFRDFLPVTVLVTVDGNSRVVFARGGGGWVKSEFCREGGWRGEARRDCRVESRERQAYFLDRTILILGIG